VNPSPAHDTDVELTFEASSTVFEEGAPADVAYIVRQGRLAVVKCSSSGEGVLIGQRAGGEIIGEMALISESPRSASVIAIEDTKLLVVTRERFRRLLIEDPDFGDYVARTLVERLRSADEAFLSAYVAERDVFNRLEKLSTQHEKLAELMQLRHETIRFIVHDLRNPLSVLSSALEMLDAELDAGGIEIARELIKVCRNALRRMLMLTESLLDVDRLDWGLDGALDLEMVSLPALIVGVAADQRPRAETVEVALEIEVPVDLPPIAADPARLERILANLIENALKYSPAGGQVTVSAWREGDSLMVAVSDVGPGIPPDQRERIFERFTQVRDDSKARRGFGLGLAYCRAAVEAHGGRIWVEDGEGGVGSRFVFSLPLDAQA
jgi:signal transduction histidine kinase